MTKESIGVSRQAATMTMRSSTGGLNSKSTTKSRTSDRLEEDTQAMEERLIQLRLKMLEDKQKLDKDLPAKFGGSRWRSAQETIGSVSRYAKDVEDRMHKSSSKGTPKKNSAEQTSNETKPKIKKQLKAVRDSALVVPSIATVNKWTTQHVLEWLTSLALDEYHSAFEFHQITGTVLLTMEPEEFVNIGVTRLSARNLLWKELGRMKAASSAVRRGSVEASEIIDPKIKDVAPVPEVPSPGKEGRIGVHWSHVKPLRDPNAPAHVAEVPVNLADGEFDEDASHASFMKALLDWRAGEDADTQATKSDDEMWFNPLMPSSSDNNDHPSSNRGGALLEGEYDEAKEQEAFRRAVLAWRRAGTPPETDLRPSTADVERIEQSCATDQRQSCWHCYRVVRADALTRDTETKHGFCGPSCLVAFQQEHARLYAKKALASPNREGI